MERAYLITVVNKVKKTVEKKLVLTIDQTYTFISEGCKTAWKNLLFRNDIIPKKEEMTILMRYTYIGEPVTTFENDLMKISLSKEYAI
jgi:effector-binding domain-containing protein